MLKVCSFEFLVPNLEFGAILMNNEDYNTSIDGSGQFAEGAAEIPLTSDDFQFVFYRDPERFFRGGNRPFRLIQTRPSLTTHLNVVYTPVVWAPNQRLGCLYDEDLTRIEPSINRYGRDDKVRNTDPERLYIQPDELPVYDRPVLYLGLFEAHFGHFVQETLSRWWALIEEFEDIDRYLVHAVSAEVLNKPYIRAALDAMQIDDEKLVYFDQPVMLRKVIVPGASFQLISHIYTTYKESQNRLARAMGAESVNKTEQPVFLSRTHETSGIRHYYGEEKIESFLAERGVRIAHPGQMSFQDQIKLVNEHPIIMGYQGSQLGSVTLALEPKTLVQFTDSKVWANYMLIDKCFDHNSTYVRSCDWTFYPREIYRKVISRATGKKSFDGFRFRHTVDYEKTVAWLETSGYLD
jgi:capsular polysaccharide biosynthesis protein